LSQYPGEDARVEERGGWLEQVERFQEHQAHVGIRPVRSPSGLIEIIDVVPWGTLLK
jgi:hypothetical protein